MWEQMCIRDRSKGPAVHSLRAQADKNRYSSTMRQVLESQDRLEIKQAEIVKILVEDGKVVGVQTLSGGIYYCNAVILCTGTYLKARCVYGEVSENTGPNGLKAANYLTDSLKAVSYTHLQLNSSNGNTVSVKRYHS